LISAVCSLKKFNFINILSYNVGGLKSKVVYYDFFTYVCSFNVFFLYETHVEEKDIESFTKFFPGFKLLFLPAKRVSNFGRASGGSVYGFKIDLLNLFELEFKLFHKTYALSMRGKNGFLNIIPVYINCNNWSEDFDRISESFNVCSIQNCIFIGDVNARVGALQNLEFVDDVCSSSLTALRVSKDRVVDAKGRKLLEFFNDEGLVILNGRSPDDSSGELTFAGSMGQSVIDLCGVSLNVLNMVNRFKIGPQVFSDHFPLELCITFDQVIEKISNRNVSKILRLNWGNNRTP
jgi:hypothetical protein